MLTVLPDWNWPGILLGGGALALWLFCAIKLLIRRLAPKKTVHARIVDKFITELPNFKATGPRYSYTVVFQTEDRKRGFRVSELTYRGYHRGESGSLTYQGSRLIDFH